MYKKLGLVASSYRRTCITETEWMYGHRSDNHGRSPKLVKMVAHEFCNPIHYIYCQQSDVDVDVIGK